ncbi:MAG: hypothetical protein FWF18_04650 [Dehalococcoidia bacterium]|nr:hypothetical protein [Dehalococcoidia bacterium]
MFGDTRPKVISFQWSVFSFVQVHPGGSAATEESGGGGVPVTTSPPPPDASSLAGSFLQHGFMTKSILEGVQRPKDLVAGCQLLLPPPPDASSLAGSFLQHGFTTKSILEGVKRPKDLAAGCQLLLPASSRCFVTRRLVPPAWIYD